MFVCYIPGERAGFCYTVGVLSPLAKNSRLCSKNEARKNQQSMCLQCFSWRVDFQKPYYCTTTESTCASYQEVSLIVRACSCLCLISKPVDLGNVFRISCKDLKSMLSQVNYRVPNMRFLREKLPVTSFYLTQTVFPLYLPAFPFDMMLLEAKDLRFVVNGPSAFPLISPLVLQDSELRNGDVSFSQFAQLYRSLMFDAQRSVSAVILCIHRQFCPSTIIPHLMPCQGTLPPHLSVLKWLRDQYGPVKNPPNPSGGGHQDTLTWMRRQAGRLGSD